MPEDLPASERARLSARYWRWSQSHVAAGRQQGEDRASKNRHRRHHRQPEDQQRRIQTYAATMQIVGGIDAAMRTRAVGGGALHGTSAAGGRSGSGPYSRVRRVDRDISIAARPRRRRVRRPAPSVETRLHAERVPRATTRAEA